MAHTNTISFLFLSFLFSRVCFLRKVVVIWGGMSRWNFFTKRKKKERWTVVVVVVFSTTTVFLTRINNYTRG